MAFYSTVNGMKTDDAAEWRDLLARLRTKRRKPKPALTNSLFSVVVDGSTSGADAKALNHTLESLLGQSFHNFETILEEVAAHDMPRLDTLRDRFRKFRGLFLEHVQRGPKDGSDSAAPALTPRGDYVLFLAAGHVLEPDCLSALNAKIAQQPQMFPLDIISFDHMSGALQTVAFLPGWDPDFLLDRDYLQGAAVISSRLLAAPSVAHGPKSGPEMLAALAASQTNLATAHIASPLIDLTPVPALPRAETRTAAAGDGKPALSIIIPTRNNLAMLQDCLAFLDNDLPFTVEVVLVDNASDPAQVSDYYTRLQRQFDTRIVPMNHRFNYARMINLGVQASRHPNLLLLNNDVVIPHPACLTKALQTIARPEVGIAGSLLVYPDTRVQHGGMLLHLTEGEGLPSAQHLFHFAEAGQDSYLDMETATQNCQAVTGAFQMVRREVFHAVEGYDEVSLPVEYNDVDFCLKVRELGLRVLKLPLQGVVHHESATRGRQDTAATLQMRHEAQKVILSRWRKQFAQDPYENPNVRLGETVAAFLTETV